MFDQQIHQPLNAFGRFIRVNHTLAQLIIKYAPTVGVNKIRRQIVLIPREGYTPLFSIGQGQFSGRRNKIIQRPGLATFTRWLTHAGLGKEIFVVVNAIGRVVIGEPPPATPKLETL